MECPHCFGKTVVIDSRKECDCVNRIRRCTECGHRFQTQEADTEVINKNGMNVNEYQKLAMRTSNKELSQDEHFLNGVLGLVGESGEIADLVKKNRMQGHPLNIEHITKELGDVCWYIAETATAIGVDLGTVMRLNIEKLKKRYPSGFSVENSMHRRPEDI